MSDRPSEREWILLNPGPANTTASVRHALVMPDLCHREPEFFEVMRDCRERLTRVAGCAPDFAAVLFTTAAYLGWQLKKRLSASPP